LKPPYRIIHAILFFIQNAADDNTKYMKKILCLFTLICVLIRPTITYSQSIKGSGKTIQKKFPLTDFNMLNFQDLDGEITVQSGIAYSVNVTIDDNLAELLEVTKNNSTLEMKLSGNRNNKLYIEKTNIRVNITMPDLVLISHKGNSNLLIQGIHSSTLEAFNSGNGNITVAGDATNLNLTNSGNGNIFAQDLLANNVNVKSSGNGNVVVNSAQEFLVNAMGNGFVKNTGKASAAINSTHSGNARILDSTTIRQILTSSIAKKPLEVTPRVQSRIKNLTPWAVKFRVMYYPSGSYGFTINPGEIHTEYFPVGTKLYRHGRKEAIEITETNKDKLFLIE
jgi:hypothetical protein